MIKYTHKRKIICYIKPNSGGYIVCTGKPSDAECLSWQYENLTDAEKTADEYYNNYTNRRLT